MENIGIIESKYKSCAALTIQCLHETGIAKQDSAFKHHIENAKELGLMPDDPQVIYKTLSDYGFVMQSTHLESASCEEIIDVLSNILTEPATLLISLRSSKNSGGYMMAARLCTPLLIERFCPVPAPEHYKSRKAIHVWIRWDDGVDRSPFPRRTVKRSSTEKRIRAFCTPFAVGDSLWHPSFGVGVITDVIPGVVTIDFGSKGLRRLGSAWVSNNCSRIAV